MSDLEYIADMIAGEANKCCYRSDGYREDIYKMALVGLRNAVLAEREACAKLCEEQDGSWWPCKSTGNECATAIRERGDK